MVGLGVVHTVSWAVLLLLVCGLAMVVVMASMNTVLQTIVEEDKRGRVMSLYGMAFMGMAPFGSLLAGGMGSVLGVPGTLAAAGGVIVLGALAFTRMIYILRPLVRAEYRKKGILSDGSSDDWPA